MPFCSRGVRWLHSTSRPKAPLSVDKSIPGALYGSANPASSNAPATNRRKNYTVPTGGWNTLHIKFWPGNANQKAYIQTWVNGNPLMDQEVVPTGSKWGTAIQSSGGIYLQSHWGSNVLFQNVSVTALTEQRPNPGP